MRMEREIWKMSRYEVRKGAGAFLLIFILCMAVCRIPVNRAYASDVTADKESSEGWIWDEAGLLTEEEERTLEEKSEQILREYGISTVVVTTNQYEGSDILDWERSIFSEQNLGAGENQSCLMLGVSMAERDWGITAYGDAEAVFGSYTRERIGGKILDYLSEGEYYGAFDTYLDLAERFMKDAEDGRVYSASNPYKERINVGYIIIGAFVLSFVTALIVVNTWKRKMNTKILQNGAGNYLKNGSAEVTARSDIFLYHTVRRTRRQKENHNSGSMHSSGNGTRGKF